MKIKKELGYLMGLGLGLGLVSTTVQAGPWDAGFTLGTMGFGPEVGYVVVPDWFNVRAQLGLFQINPTVNSGGVNYSGQFKLQNFSLLGDWHPFSGVFRTTAGVVINHNQISANAQLTAGQSYSANGVTYIAGPNDTANASLTYRTLAPYLGIGWGGDDMTPGFHFTSDIGVMFQGSPNATVNISNPAAHSYQTAAQSKLASDAGALNIWPVIELGILYRF